MSGLLVTMKDTVCLIMRNSMEPLPDFINDKSGFYLLNVIGLLIDLILPAHYGPGIDSASNRNGYQESFWG
jgi:hypothetical protein